MARLWWYVLVAVALPLLLVGCPSPESTSGQRGTSHEGAPARVSGARAQEKAEPGQPEESEAGRLMREFEQQMEELPGPPPKERTGNVIVVLERYTYDERASVQVASAWSFADERILAGSKTGPLWGRNGLHLGLATEKFRSALGLSATGRRRQVTTRMVLTLLSGSEGSLAAGTNVYVPALRCWTWAGPVVLFEREFVGSSLVVSAEVVGTDRIRLGLYPRFTSRSGRSIDVTDLRTEVMVPHGETLVIGALEESEDSLAFALFGLGGGTQHGRMLLLVTPYIEAARSAKAGGRPGE